VGLRNWYLLIILPGQAAVSSFNVLNPSMHADILPHCSVQPRAVGLGQT